MTRRRRSTRWLLSTSLVLCGCQADAGTATGGLALELHVSGEQNLSAFYRVERDGTLGFGGGEDARKRNVSWTGPMTDEEIERLHKLMREHGWYDRKLESTGEPKQRVYRIKFTSGQGSRQFRVRGESPDITPIENLLDGAARRRLQPFLDSLRQPDAPRPRGEDESEDTESAPDHL